jgi:hypothetical protein
LSHATYYIIYNKWRYIKILKKEYEGEDLYDLEGDLISIFNKIYEKTPGAKVFDSDGLLQGTYKVTVELKE